MRVVVGPVAVTSATAWLAHARGLLEELEDLAPGECFSTPEVLSVFDRYLRSWEMCARECTSEHDEFLWEAEIPAEQVEYHMHAFEKVAGMLAERRERMPMAPAPEEGDDFYRAMLHGVLVALEAEGPSHAAFAQHLTKFWPGRVKIS